MKLKLTNKEITLLLTICMNVRSKYRAQAAESPDGEQMEPLLFCSLFEEAAFQLHKKCFLVKKVYHVALRPSVMFAFHLEFAGLVDLRTPEGVFLNRICAEWHKQVTDNQNIQPFQYLGV